MGDQVSFVEIINTQLKSDKAQLPVFNKTAMRIQNEISKKDPDVQFIILQRSARNNDNSPGSGPLGYK